MLHVFDSGAGGQYVSDLLHTNGISNRLVTYPNLFPFGTKSPSELLAIFHSFREEQEGTIFCACNTMSLVLESHSYDFRANDVIPTFPRTDAEAPVCFGTRNTVELAGLVYPDFRGVDASLLVQAAEDVYRNKIIVGEARDLFERMITEPVQLGSTHLSYLAHLIGQAEGHVEPDYVGLYRAHVGETE